MNRATRHHVDRRSVALDRLESITAGAAIAGVAGTIGFGALAALTFSGTASAATAPADPVVPDIRTESGGSDDNGGIQVQPNTDEDNGSQLFQVAPPPRSATGRGGHASTGGSG